MADMTPLLEMLKTSWQEQADKVSTYDEKLNTDGGSGALARDAIADYGNAEAVTAAVTNLVTVSDPRELLAVTALIRKALRSVEGQVKKYVDDNKVEVTELPAEEVTALRAGRKTAVDAANALRIAASASNPVWATEGTNLDDMFPQLSNLRGAGPGQRKKSPRLRGSFSWALDGNAIPGTGVADVAKRLGVSVGDVKEAMMKYWQEKRGVEFPFGDPPDEFQFTFTTGDPEDAEGHHDYSVSAAKLESDVEDSDSDDEAFEEPDEDGDIFAN
jgi:hypothetical protein